MKILIITPAAPNSRAGNRATALRWKNLLESSGHHVSVITDYRGEACDAFLALHAWRSRAVIQSFRKAWPETPLLVVLTGTDIYDHQRRFPSETQASMDAADILIGLHDLVAQDIPIEYTNKLITLYQSADSARRTHESIQSSSDFKVCVIGHLRDEKDSLRAALAARLLPDYSNIRILCAGKPYDSAWKNAAEAETQVNSRFQWLGELNEYDIKQLMIDSKVMVISSTMEGGANVVSEACRAGLPIIASDIPGNRGLLGGDYAGYYPVGDEKALAAMLQRAETDSGFLNTLRHQVDQAAIRFSPDNERHTLELALKKAAQNCTARTIIF